MRSPFHVCPPSRSATSKISSISGTFLRLAPLALVGALALAAISTGGVVSAAPKPVHAGPSSNIPSHATITHGGTGPYALTGPGGGGPICDSSSDYPHLSGHNPGYVSAIGHTDCLSEQPYVYTDATLYRQDCVLGICVWTKVGYAKQGLVNVMSTEAVPNHLCNGSASHLYDIVTVSEVTFTDGSSGEDITGQTQTVTCG